jgi:predicted TIM-barrel fold metal-dependent hydrolase
MRLFITFLLATILWGCNSNKERETHFNKSEPYNGPIIDMHLHADGEDDIPPVKMGFCAPVSTMLPYYDTRKDFNDVWDDLFANPKCDNPFWSPKSFGDYLNQVESKLTENKVVAVASGTVDNVRVFKSRMPNNIISGIQFRVGRDTISAEQLRALILENDIKIIGEISNQYGNIAPNDPRMFPYYKLAEELDIPVAIHLGSGLPGIMYYWEPEYRAKLSNPLALEEVLRKFPKLRVSIMHYADPFIDELITMLYHYPQLYIDLGGIQWNYPREYFYEYHLKKIISAGFQKRIMFGSDMIIWPDFITHSIDIINEAPFLSYEQKADIFYNNASRFLRLEENQK